jgi:uncharacterized membrane protein
MFNGLKNRSASSFFVWAALFFELLLNVVTPPLQAPDEFNHFYRAYQISEGGFLPVKQDRRLGGDMPIGLLSFTDQYKQCVYIKNYTISYEEILISLRVNTDNNRKFQDFANTAYYSPVSYLPQAFILFVLRLFQAPPALFYYGGRLFTFLVWLFFMHRLIKNLPAFKWLFTLLALLPMNLYLVNSFSADTVTNLISFLFIATVLKHIFVTERITRRDLLLLGLLLGLMALAKVVYIGLGILLLAIPGHKFRNIYSRVGGLALLLLVSCLLAALWSGVVMQLYIPSKDYNPLFTYEATLSSCADYYAQKEYILSHGIYFFKVIWHSISQGLSFFMSSYVGVFGQIDVRLPHWMYLVSYLVLAAVPLAEKSPFRLSIGQKLLLLAAISLTFVLLLLSQHLMWDCVGDGVVDLVQGRYLIPFFPLVLLLLNNSFIKIKASPAWLVIPFLVLLNSYSCYAIHQHFFTGPPAEITEIACDAEEVTADGNFKTTDPRVTLSGGNTQVNTEQHSGKHSAILQPGFYCFTGGFKALRTGDLVEVEAWEKGEGSLLSISGRQAGCCEFIFEGTFRSGSDKPDWHRIKMVYINRNRCDSVEGGIYAWNRGKTAVFLDDIKIRITRFKR